MFMMRFDLRAPSIGAPARELYAAALDMAAWAEDKGCVSIALCEHHAADDGYLPSPLLMASAVAARTKTVPITIAAVVLPLHDPIRLAEDMAVLDNLSGGRVMHIVAVGYRPEEYEQLGVDFRRRGKRMDEVLPLLLRAKAGEPFEHDGRRIHVTPRPLTPGGPAVIGGGGSPAAARRAGRNGIGFIAQGGIRSRSRRRTPPPRRRRGSPPSCAWSHPPACRRRCSWPTTSSGPGRRSGPTSSTTPRRTRRGTKATRRP